MSDKRIPPPGDLLELPGFREAKERIEKMKSTAVFVNTARGAVVDEAELCKALKQGRIAAMGTDVYSAEPFREDSPFYEIKDLDNVCLTPHMAWGAHEARVRCLEEIAANIRAFFAGEVRCRVD